MKSKIHCRAIVPSAHLSDLRPRKNKGAGHPAPLKKQGRRYYRLNTALRAQFGNFPYAQAGLPPESRDTTQVSDKFYTELKPAAIVTAVASFVMA